MQLSAAKRKYKTLNSSAGNADAEAAAEAGGDSLKQYVLELPQTKLKHTQDILHTVHTHSRNTFSAPSADVLQRQQFDGTLRRHSVCGVLCCKGGMSIRHSTWTNKQVQKPGSNTPDIFTPARLAVNLGQFLGNTQKPNRGPSGCQ